MPNRTVVLKMVLSLDGFATSLDVVTSRALRNVSEVDINYRKSPIVKQDRSSVWSAAPKGDGSTYR